MSFPEKTKLSSLIEQTTIEAVLDWKKWKETQVFQEEDFMWMLSRYPQAFFNNVLRCTLKGDALTAKLKSLLNQLENEEKGLTWFVLPSSGDELGPVLRKNGFSHTGDFTGMAAKVSDLLIERSPMHELKIQKVIDMDGLKIWGDVSAEVYGLEGDAKTAWFQVHEALGLGTESNWQHYVGFISNVPVATSSVFAGEKALRLSNVAVLPDFRKKGLGQQLSVEPFLQDKPKNHLVTLISTPMAVSVYRNIGFSEYFSSQCFVHD